MPLIDLANPTRFLAFSARILPALWVVAARAEKNIVLAGDFMQLPPVNQAQHELADKWLGRDVFEAAGVRGLAGVAPECAAAGPGSSWAGCRVSWS